MMRLCRRGLLQLRRPPLVPVTNALGACNGRFFGVGTGFGARRFAATVQAVAAGAFSLSLVLGGLWRNQDVLLDYLEDKLKARAFDRLPERIIVLRHGESEGQVDRSIMATEPDNRLELTKKGREQAFAAGQRIKEMIGPDGSIIAVLSPFERTQQTLCCLLDGLGEDRVREVTVDTRVRELEFANLQNATLEQAQQAMREKEVVGRFWHRPPTGESQADVYDRVSDFWESFTSGYRIRTRFSTSNLQAYQGDKALLIVSHGLTSRLLLMRYFSWSVDTVETVYNPDNCDMWVLKKNHEKRVYDLSPQDSYPPRVPASARQVRLYPPGTGHKEMTPDGGEPYTILDYLSITPPRTANKREALAKVVKGHPNLDPTRNPGEYEKALARSESLNPNRYEIDWWCGDKSADAITMRLTFLRMSGYGYGNPRAGR